MANDFYMATGNPATRSQGQSSVIRSEFAGIEDGFDKMPTLTGNAGKAVVVNPGATALGLTVGALALAGNFATVGAFALSLTVTGATNVTLPTTGTLATLAGAETLLNKTLTAPVLTTPTVSGGTFTSPVLVAPQLGTPVSGDLSNCTALPISTGVSGLAAGIATFLGAPSSANLRAAVTDETGSGSLVFGTSPTLTTPTLNTPTLTAPNLGTPSAGNLVNCTGLPLTTGVSGVLPQANGGTGSAGPVPQGAVWFGGAAGTLGWDVSTLNWNNATKALGIGLAASGDSIRRLQIKSYAGAGAYPLIIQNGTGTAEAFAIQQDSGNNFSLIVGDAANQRKVFLNSAGDSYLIGGRVGIGTASTAELLHVSDGANGARVFFGEAGAARRGILFSASAPDIAAGFTRILSHDYGAGLALPLLLNSIGGGVQIGAQRIPAAVLDVAGSISVNDNELTYTAYNGGTNTATIRAGIKYSGSLQEVQVFTANTYRGAFMANGNLYWGSRLGIGVVPQNTWTSFAQLSGDITMTQAVSNIFFNSYNDGSWRYANNGWPCFIRNDGAGLLTFWGGGQNTTGPGTVIPSLVNILTMNVASGNVAVGGAPGGRKFAVLGNQNSELAIHIANASTGASASSILYTDLSSVPNGYLAMSALYNSGTPIARIASGAAITALIFDAGGGKQQFYVAGVEKMAILSNTVFASVPYSSNSTVANQFGNMILQGLTGTAGYLRTVDATPLYLGVNNGNFYGMTADGAYFYPLNDNGSQLGGSGNRWNNVHSFYHTWYGTTSGNTLLRAQAAAANNTVFLPNFNGTLLIGGTQVTAALGANVNLNNSAVYFDGPAISLGAGTWFVSGSIASFCPSVTRVDSKLWDGTNVIQEGTLYLGTAPGQSSTHLSGYITLGSTTTVKISAKATATNASLLYNVDGAGKGCTITAFRVA